MKIYKHYSFDLWMTLIKSNPLFKTERARFFHKYFNSTKKSMEEVVSIFRKVDLLCNSINEKTGNNIDTDEMHLMVIGIMNDYNSKFSDINLNWLYAEMENLFFNYLPFLYCNKTINSLDRIKQKNNSSFSILSNTAFIKGATLRKVLSELTLSPFFDFQLYSDEVNMSKPNIRFFKLMLENVKNIDSSKSISTEEIIHVGDNPIADIAGAMSVGIDSIQINSNDLTILSLLN